MEQLPRQNKAPYKFEDIYAAFYPKILRYVDRLIGHDAEDVTQEVFLKVNAALPNFRGESSLSTWVYRITTNTAVDHLRKISCGWPEHKSALPADGDFPDDNEDMAGEALATSLDSQLVRKEMNECIRGIVDGLPESYRTVLALSEMEEFTNAEISEILGVSLDTVKIRLHRARARLKKALESNCNFYRDERNELACDRKATALKFLEN
ncbi:MAG: sigma-70 family RNA polymerase sigma factor [Nitrospiraceae bacterium]|nr:sigma-70 family RNA polymerase sigma factor [Nitrospiraceae bacterium]